MAHGVLVTPFVLINPPSPLPSFHSTRAARDGTSGFSPINAVDIRQQPQEVRAPAPVLNLAVSDTAVFMFVHHKPSAQARRTVPRVFAQFADELARARVGAGACAGAEDAPESYLFQLAFDRLSGLRDLKKGAALRGGFILCNPNVLRHAPTLLVDACPDVVLVRDTKGSLIPLIIKESSVVLDRTINFPQVHSAASHVMSRAACNVGVGTSTAQRHSHRPRQQQAAHGESTRSTRADHDGSSGNSGSGSASTHHLARHALTIDDDGFVILGREHLPQRSRDSSRSTKTGGAAAASGLDADKDTCVGMVFVTTQSRLMSAIVQGDVGAVGEILDQWDSSEGEDGGGGKGPHPLSVLCDNHRSLLHLAIDVASDASTPQSGQAPLAREANSRKTHGVVLKCIAHLEKPRHTDIAIQLLSQQVRTETILCCCCWWFGGLVVD